MQLPALIFRFSCSLLEVDESLCLFLSITFTVKIDYSVLALVVLARNLFVVLNLLDLSFYDTLLCEFSKALGLKYFNIWLG